MILRIRVVFWKSYSRLKWIWPTFSVGSELSMYMSTRDMERFCQKAICTSDTAAAAADDPEKKERKKGNTQYD